MGGTSRRAHLVPAPLGPAVALPTAAAPTAPPRAPPNRLRVTVLLIVVAAALATFALSSWRLHAVAGSGSVGGTSAPRAAAAGASSLSAGGAEAKAAAGHERVIRFPQPLRVQIQRTGGVDSDSSGGDRGGKNKQGTAAAVEAATAGGAPPASALQHQAPLPPQHLGRDEETTVAVTAAAAVAAAAAAEASGGAVGDDSSNAHTAAAAGGPLAAAAGASAAAQQKPPTGQQHATVHGSSPPLPGVAPAPCQPLGGSTAAVAIPPHLSKAAVASAGSLQPSMSASGPAPLTNPLWWHGPIWSGSGYGSEAVNFVLSLLRSGLVRQEDMWASNHGDHARDQVVARMSPSDRSDLRRAEARPSAATGGARDRPAVIVCHSMPPNYAVPDPAYWAGERCPPDPKRYGWSYSVARTMFESDGIPMAFVPRCNSMNEVWVPSEWQRETFAASGVDPSKIRVVPEGVNTSYFDPVKHAPLTNLAARAQLVLGSSWDDKTGPAYAIITGAAGIGSRSRKWRGRRRRRQQKRRLQRAGPFAMEGGGDSSSGEGQPPQQPFRFISSFKWEPRKGWDLLLEAYLEEFTADDPVELYILTKPFGDSGDGFSDKMRTWAALRFGSPVTPPPRPPPVPPPPPPRAPVEVQGVGPDGLLRVTPAPPPLPASTAPPAATAAAQLSAAGTGAAAVPITRQPQRHLSSHPDAAAANDADAHSELKPHLGGEQLPRHRRNRSPARKGVAGQRREQPPPRKHDRRRLAATKGAAAPRPAAVARGLRVVAGKLLNISAFPALYVVNTHLSDQEFPRFYASGDAFVLPSRGEGWGRPQVEAMSMALPVISTNWSGVTAYLDDSVGYPLAVEKLVPAYAAGEVWNRGLSWAQPSVPHLRALMRRVVERRAEAAARGAAARARMVERYSPAAMARLMVDELRRIEALLPQFD